VERHKKSAIFCVRPSSLTALRTSVEVLPSRSRRSVGQPVHKRHPFTACLHGRMVRASLMFGTWSSNGTRATYGEMTGRRTARALGRAIEHIVTPGNLPRRTRSRALRGLPLQVTTAQTRASANRIAPRAGLSPALTGTSSHPEGSSTEPLGTYALTSRPRQPRHHECAREQSLTSAQSAAERRTGGNQLRANGVPTCDRVSNWLLT
jgi:hypothetical protein